MADVLYPIVIVLGCLAIVGIIHLVTRPRPSAGDIALPVRSLPDVQERHGPALATWHLEYGDALVDFISAHDELAESAPRSVQRAHLDQVDAALRTAIAAHPFIEMRGELSALAAAAESMRAAAERADDDVAIEHQRVYLTYREAWLERLWQFPADTERIAALRARSVPPLGSP